MKIYFTGSLHNRDIDKNLYRKIVSHLENQGYRVQSNHILGTSATNLGKQTVSEKTDYYQKLSKWIASSDIVVCEVSYPSTINIGHEVSLALDKGKPIVALYQKGREPGILQGVSSESFILLEYSNETQIINVLKQGLEDAKEQMDVRFNFFISPKIGVYLDWVSKNKKIPRAVYLRKLIEEDMKKNKDFKGK